MTASVTFCPKYISAVSFILVNTIALISSGLKSFCSLLNSTLSFGLRAWFITLKGQCLNLVGFWDHHIFCHKSFCIEDGVLRIHGNLGLGCISISLSVSEGNIARCCSVALVLAMISTFPCWNTQHMSRLFPNRFQSQVLSRSAFRMKY
ncbi:hypothetical protein TNCT_554431 [Trichonephila clavata]|uniref:Uncharacterized protein n=1 Tax=Trichonephila clavata TaxID=2740835 RepID=A0A8X6L690_TRICU|nr:hypothetical protein TNCT_554431 [Trichonephila clavata]